jgi:hypothetical protein
VLGLAGKHGADRLERACARAIEVGDPSYRTIKGILAAGAEALPAPEPSGDGGAAAHLHGPSRLFGNVVAMPTTSPSPATATTTASGANPGPGPREPHAPEDPGQREPTEPTVPDQLTLDVLGQTTTDQPTDQPTDSEAAS